MGRKRLKQKWRLSDTAEQKDTIVLITGSNSGIGFEMAMELVGKGAEVILACRQRTRGEEAKKRILQRHADGRVHLVSLDLADLESIEMAAAEVVSSFPRLDVLINNAGVAWGAPLAEFPEAGWDKVMDTNVKGPFFLTQQLLPLLEAAATFEEPARIVNVGSIDGIKTPIFDNFSYGPSKAAIHHLTRVLAAHLIKRNIIVNGIAPGPFPTWMLSTGVGGGGDVDNTDWDAVGKGNPRGRVGQAEDIAGLAIFLSSKASGFTVGDVITCDGGSVVS